MGLFDKLFGRKQTPPPPAQEDEKKTVELQAGDQVVGTGDGIFYKIVRPLSTEQQAAIDQSTIPVRTGQLFMHYWSEGLTNENREDPQWQNQVLFFWKADEAFPRKSLPPVFETFRQKYFLFTGDLSDLSLKMAQAMPWFGMPGMGEKHVCERNAEAATVPELYSLGKVEYVAPVVLTAENLGLLTERERCFLLIDEDRTPFHNGALHLDGNPIPVSLAYSIGSVQLMERVKSD